MTYRSDHDAALARADALEIENARLTTEVAELREPNQPTAVKDFEQPNTRIVLKLLGAGAVFAIVLIGVAGTRERNDATEGFDARMTQVARVPLVKCALAIPQNPHFDARLTDPHVEAPVNVDTIKATIAPCRNDLQVYRDSGVIDLHERDAIGRWLAAEDELAGSISRIVVYYGNEPYLLDGYSSAQQLWTEYDRALAHRDVAIADWRHTTE